MLPRFRCRPGPSTIGCLALLLALAEGCAEKEKPAEIILLEGKLTKISRTADNADEITVLFYNEKQKQEMLGTAFVTKETEILIDDAAGSLKDLKEGERIRGEVRVEKKAGKKINTVLKIRVDRPKPSGGTGG